MLAAARNGSDTIGIRENERLSAAYGEPRVCERLRFLLQAGPWR